MQRSLAGRRISTFTRWRRQRQFRNAATLLVVIAGPVLALLTYIAFGPLDLGGSAPSLRIVLLADLVYILVVAALLAQRVARMITARREKSAGSGLHLRLTGTFALLALIPTVIVAVFSVLTINIGLEGWFSDRVRTVLGTSLDAAQAYEEEHRQDISRDGLALAERLNRERAQTFFMSDGEIRQALGRWQDQIEPGLIEVFVIDSGGAIRARGVRSYEFGYEEPPADAFVRAEDDGIAVLEDYPNNEFRALIPLDAFLDRYLYVTREVDGEILSLLDETQATVALYEQLEEERGRLLFEFGLLYLGFAVILILAAIWLGLWFAEGIARPVGRLVSASQRVGSGDLDVQVIEDEGDDEIGLLGQYFNQMTTRLKAQREELLDNTNQIERRRRLFDSVLSSVTSGVVGLDADGRIAFANRSAQRLLDLGNNRADTALPVAIPEFGPLFTRLVDQNLIVVQEQVSLIRGGQQETLLVRMSRRLRGDDTLEGFVVAFDDVTDLVSAQRMAAWGDVARRIAHEIKNPLTPIKLSAERIRRKYGSEVSEPEKLANMTDVIVRQTDDLRRIVDEFSKFARMPEPDLREDDLAGLMRGAVTLQEAGQPDVTIRAELPDMPVIADVDSTMISQAFTNLIKNAGEAIETLKETGAPDGFEPEVRVEMSVAETAVRIVISDNGIGLPEDRVRLFEPYVTTRDKGTGLGLPIVKKIIEEHGGTLTLVDAEPFTPGAHCGAAAIITLPILPQAAGTAQTRITA
ncbi:PAS domain-containing sensor histidine kinase [Ponticoccus sp. SC2-23]|uniref:sensor histidine kinase NtrY-like n=1 Tax=Alexandriicola marinus TaxID=2081710 RepID=UPI000FD77DD5|nr:PAS domain-containing sensor histidine kinase [Alexandriicola marinus]MBM1218829.1 PAS domain-containing sensor histidine kinase [Ponticoccus sp. SC6-9]MBM1224099.1 PAS domain-containing sensor histidine kinase [Ponticoccus sp. SC6-15]MBM1230122.1 PAS domain-containing sensor histidine kinase [Ponticoccus sp. SC6-38]MBM1233065.1 PAS domain-containing sensor histidine kinase [Ponticoccus sp. SC6-45]MBM1236985.1 PAS domain-containing sensor histidine kinase [Ponticoccus sp. SC6-49]MBM1242076